jgi:hypothetical protein
MKDKKEPPVERFSGAYLAYLGALAAIVGPATPLVAAFTRALPTFDVHAPLIGGLAFLLNLTLVALVMFWRHSLVRHLFSFRNGRYRASPLVVTLLVGSLCLGALFLVLYFRSWSRTRDNLAMILADQDIVTKATLDQLPWPELTIFYCCSFLLLQLAFSIMALKEYGQSVLKLSEKALLE